MNPDLERLQPYPFQRLAGLLHGVTAPQDLPVISLTIGEPKHPTPGFISEAVLSHLHNLSVYPSTRGSLELRQAIVDWLTRRYHLPAASLDPERQVLPVNGTREALFAIAQAVVDRARPHPLVLMPNPFYQIYEGAALLAGAEPGFIPCDPEHGFVPDFDRVSPAQWARCQLLYLCSPGNPTGAVLDLETLQRLLELAERYDFLIAADECYAEIYPDEGQPPPGLLQAAARTGNLDYRRCLVFHSLSKRSNAPGLRSGFVAGDARVLDAFFQYRTYHGCAMPLQHQSASTLAWRDEAHVTANRTLYRAKFAAVLATLGPALELRQPAGGFYLWPRTPLADTEFARRLYQSQGVSVLPGSYLARTVDGHNPGADRVRLALVAPLDECIEAAGRLRLFLETL